MKTIKIFLASSEELENDRKEFGNLIRRLDDIYFRRGVHLQLIMWEDLDFAYNNQRKQDEYNEAIRQCDVFIALFYKQAGKYTLEEFDVAKQENLKRKLPQVIIYCRDLLENDVESAALADFKQQLDKELGHFWGRYGTNDKLHLDFVLWLQRSTINDSASLKVENGNVMFDEAKIASMDNLQFASDNANYQKQKEKLATLSAEIEQLWQAIEQTPSLDFLRQLHQQKLNEYNALKEEFEQYQQALFNTAKRISQMQLEQTSDLIRRAVEAFEKGNIERTNTLLDEVAYEAEHHMERLEQDRNLVHQDIEAFQLQAKTIMADTSLDIEERKERALSIYQKADEWAEKSALDKEKYVYLLFNYANFLIDFSYYPQAEAICLKQILFTQSLYGEKNVYTAIAYNNTGAIYNYLGKYTKALKYCKKALNVSNNVTYYKRQLTATCYGNIGSAYQSLREYKKALMYYQKSLIIRDIISGYDNPNTAISYNNIGSAYESMGEHIKALEFYQKALDVFEKNLGYEHPNTAISYNNIGSVYESMGEHIKALEFYQKALDIQEKNLGYENSNTATSYINIGGTYESMGEHIKALEFYQKSLNIRKKILGYKHPDTAIVYNNIGNVYYSIEEYTNALEYYQKSLDVWEKTLDNKHLDTAISYYNIGNTYESMGEHIKALEFYQKALDIKEKVLGDKHPEIATLYEKIGYMYNSLEKHTKALQYYHKALDIQKKILGEKHPEIAILYNTISLIYYSLEEYKKTLEYNKKALDIQKEVLGEKHSDTANSYDIIGWIYHSFGENSKALEYYQKALNIQIEVLGEENPLTIRTQNNIETIQQQLSNTQD